MKHRSTFRAFCQSIYSLNSHEGGFTKPSSSRQGRPRIEAHLISTENVINGVNVSRVGDRKCCANDV